MNRGSFATQVNACDSLLESIGLSWEREFFPEYHPNPFSRVKHMDYVDMWLELFSTSSFTFLLADYSLLDFRFLQANPLKVSYSFFECPFQVGTYKDFLFEILGLDPALSEKELALIGDDYRQEYEDHLLTSPKKAAVSPIRYDLDTETYSEGQHPAGHVHFGYKSNIRVSTKKKLKPLSFLLFIIRQFYIREWIQLLARPSTRNLFANVRDGLDDVEAVYFQPNDLKEMTLH